MYTSSVAVYMYKYIYVQGIVVKNVMILMVSFMIGSMEYIHTAVDETFPSLVAYDRLLHYIAC